MPNRLKLDLDADRFVTSMRIDGEALIELISAIEKEQSGSGVSYDYLHASQIMSPNRRLLGEGDDDDIEQANLVYILECDCRCTGCSPLLVRIDVSDSTVTWSGFEQYRHPDWQYELRFEFDRREYEQALGFTA